MRLFIGVGVDQRVRREAERVGTEMRARLGGVRATWVRSENLHLTVRFIGQVPDDRVDTLLEAVARPLDTGAFDMQFSGCGRFPAHGAPRVIWIGLLGGLPELAALHEEFNRRLEPLGYPPEARPFSVHLTIARIKDAPAGIGRFVDSALSASDVEPLVQRVDRVTIFESRPSPKGPTYAAVREVPLRTPDC
jgi:RNA 2',3'-cyclic 3'-phosphodiesterase